MPRASFTTREFSGILLLKVLQIGERDALVERVRRSPAGCPSRAAASLPSLIGSKLGSKIGRLQLRRAPSSARRRSRAAADRRTAAANAPAACAFSAASCSSSNVKDGQELLRRDLVVVAAVRPEEQRVLANLGERRGGTPARRAMIPSSSRFSRSP